MRSLFSRSPDLEGGQNRTYKKGFTGDHRGRTHIPPHPSPIFSTQSQQDPFNAPPAAYRHDTIFKPPPSPSPKSVTFSDRSWSALSGAGTAGNTAGSGRLRNAPATDRTQLDKEQLERLHEYLGVLPGSGAPQREKRRYSMSDPNDRPIPNSSTPSPLSPQSRIKKNLKQKAAEQHFRRNNQSSGNSQDRLLGEEEQVYYQTHLFKEALRTALSMRRGGEEERVFAGEVKRPVMQRRGASEGMREGGFVGPLEERKVEEVLPRDLAEFLEKYDPRSEDLPDVYPMGEHRAMLRTMYLEDILHSTAKLHKHNWILLSRNEKYKDLRIPDRWDQIQEDLEKYTRSIRNYEYWLSSPMPLLNLNKSSLPPRFHLYGKQLAILELAKSINNPHETAFTNELEKKLVAYHTDWSISNGVWRNIRRETRNRGWRRGNALGNWLRRVLGAVIGGACVLAPVAGLVLWPGGVGRVAGVGVVGGSLVVVGVILAWGVGGGEKGNGNAGWEGIWGSRERDSRSGFGLGGEWGMRDTGLVLGCYAAVLVLFLGVAVV
ncbi:hypothetical protein EAF04_007216 [Stromatinia cepivora]|nr:hypothetical protein EAF04_007216 [Stromatinia cepivora]